MATEASPSAHPADAPVIHSDLEELVAVVSSPAELDQASGKFLSQTTTLLPDNMFQSSVDSGGMSGPVTDPSPIASQIVMMPPSSVPDVGYGFMSRSSPLVTAASDCMTPPTPLSHGSASSPMAQAVLPDGTTVSIPSLFPSNLTTTDSTLLQPSTTSLSPSQPSPADISKPGMPPPPKRPLTPYMRFSKKIWPEIKAANQNASVCEIGATIGRLWREMGGEEKQQYNDDFNQDKARYDDELQVYLKTNGPQASSQPKPKAKKSRPSAAAAAAAAATVANNNSQYRPNVATQGSDGLAFGYAGDDVNNTDSNAASTNFHSAASVGNGLVTGGLPHFSQVWSGTGDTDAYDADKLLAQMGTNGQANTFYTSQTVHNASAIMPMDGNVHHQVATVFSNDHNQMLSNMGAAPSNQDASMSGAQNQHDATAMTNWLWQQYAIANGDQFAATATPGDVIQNGTDPVAAAANANGMIIYQLNPDGTPAAYTQPVVPVSAMTTATSDALEPGEVRMPVANGPGMSATADQIYPGLSTEASYQFTGGAVANGQWLSHDGGATGTLVSGSADGEKQLLRGALVEKVREIQRLTRELEQAYALIHQLKQHNEFLQRQWGQGVVSSDGTTART